MPYSVICTLELYVVAAIAVVRAERGEMQGEMFELQEGPYAIRSQKREKL